MARNMLLQPTSTSRKRHSLRQVLHGDRNRTLSTTGASGGRKLLALSRRLELRERQRSQRRYRQRGEVCSSPHFLTLTSLSFFPILSRNPIISQRAPVPEKSDDKQANRRQHPETGLSGATPDPSSDGRTETNLVQDFRETTPTSTSTSGR